MTDCIFCKIANGEQPATIVYQDDQVVAFDDLYPKAPFHKLIIPRKHINTLNDANENDTKLLGHMMLVAQKMAMQLGIAEPGYRVLMNCNKGGGQVIYHLHLHLLGGRVMNWPPG
ncbi:MAG: histidine triad nucleotide-binding protein [Coxiellaceae bacterium]|nr:MAG: histidine triad nucleotide-binding protein [Coxiellaceae bacterium]